MERLRRMGTQLFSWRIESCEMGNVTKAAKKVKATFAELD
jgi:hypothetical protein